MPDATPPSPPPPRAFTQGTGTVFQFAGVTLFVLSMLTCCSTGLLSTQTAVRPDLQKIGWPLHRDPPAYSVQQATTIAMTCTVFYGIALASLGLGLQATHRRAPLAAAALTIGATAFYAVHTIFFATSLHSLWLPAACLVLSLASFALAGLSVGAIRDLRRSPPPQDFEILPADYRVPYSHLHQDPPEVRLQRELELRRQRLEVQQKELQLLEDKLKRRLNEADEPRE